MNRRNLIATFALSLLSGSAYGQTRESTPTTARRGDLITSSAVEVTEHFCVGPPSDGDTPLLLYKVFVFQSDVDAKETFSTIPNQVAEWKAAERFYDRLYHREISIGKVGEIQIGYIHDEGTQLVGYAISGLLLAAFQILADDALSVYTESILPMLEANPTLDIDIDEFPPGWSKENSEDFSDRHIPISGN